jgi:ATP-dependent RNA helicase SUPV3L1/SUV3
MERAIGDGALRGLARGIAWRVTQNGGVLDRAQVAGEVAALSHAERRALKSAGLRFGAFTLFLPALLTEEALAFTAAFAAVEAEGWTLSGRGLRRLGAATWPVLKLERLDEVLRAANFALTDAGLETLGWSRKEGEAALRALDFFPTRKARDGEPALWRRRAQARAAKSSPAANPASPFAALAALTEAAPTRRPRRRKRPAKKRA